MDLRDNINKCKGQSKINVIESQKDRRKIIWTCSDQQGRNFFFLDDYFDDLMS